MGGQGVRDGDGGGEEEEVEETRGMRGRRGREGKAGREGGGGREEVIIRSFWPSSSPVICDSVQVSLCPLLQRKGAVMAQGAACVKDQTCSDSVSRLPGLDLPASLRSTGNPQNNNSEELLLPRKA